MFKMIRVSLGVFRAQLIFLARKKTAGSWEYFFASQIHNTVHIKSHDLSYPSPETSVIPMCLLSFEMVYDYKI